MDLQKLTELTDKELDTLTQKITEETGRRVDQIEKKRKTFTAAEKKKIASFNKRANELRDGISKTISLISGMKIIVLAKVEDYFGDEIDIHCEDVIFTGKPTEGKCFVETCTLAYIEENRETALLEIESVQKFADEVRDKVKVLNAETDEMAEDHCLDPWDFWQEFIED